MGSTGKNTFQPRLQGLRAVAVMLVVAYHIEPALAPAGFIGVDVFFVLSGFLITRVLLHEYQDNGTIDLRAFYLRRLKRLLPALATVVLLIVLAAFVLLSPHEFSTLVRSAPYAAFWASNFLFSFNSTGYFDELGQQDLFLHTWSLSVEEQFYLFWPAFLLILMPFASQSSSTHKRPYLAWSILGLSVASLIFSISFTRLIPDFSFYMLPSRIWQFGLGGLIFILKAHPPSFLKARYLPFGLQASGLTVILAAAFVIPVDAIYPGAWSLLPSLGAAAVILGDLVDPRRSSGLLGTRALGWIGDRSYSIYLWHFPLIGLSRIIAPEDALVSILLPLLLTLALSHLTYHTFELPFWKGRFSRISPRPAFLTATLISVCVAAVTIRLSSEIALEQPAADREMAWRMSLPALYQFECDSWYASAELVPCVFGKNEVEGRSTTVVLGDSIGLQWFSLFYELYARKNWSLIVLTKSACPIVDEPIYYERIKRRYRTCEQWRDSALDYIEKLEPSLLIIGSASSYDFNQNEWERGTHTIVQRLAKVADAIRLIVGTPRLSFDGPGCVARLSDANGQIDRDRCTSSADLSEINRVRGALEQATAAIANAEVVDFSEVVCPNRRCAAIASDGMVVFRDSQHLTDSFVKTRISELSSRLDLPIRSN